jgi:hypothetical protein
MKGRWLPATLIALVQGSLVVGLAGQAALDSRHHPIAWARATSQEPSTAVKGRYLTVSLSVVADPGVAPRVDVVEGRRVPRRAQVVLEARDGRLLAHASPRSPVALVLPGNREDLAPVLSPPVDFYMPAGLDPRPLLDRDELWVEVGVPRMGPPHVLALGTMRNGQFERLQ